MEPMMEKPTVEVTYGDDGAIVVFIDTDFEPDGSDGTAGMRVWINEHIAYNGGDK